MKTRRKQPDPGAIAGVCYLLCILMIAFAMAFPQQVAP